MKIELREEDHTYWVDGVEKRSWSAIAKAAGLLPDFPDSAYAKVVNAKHRGRQIHQACAMLILGQPFDVKQLHDEALPYVQAFLEFWNIHGCRAVAETPLYHPDLDYCTTPDFHTPDTVFDIKTTDRPSRTWGLQTAAQILALGGLSHRRRIVWLRPKLKTKKYELIEPEDCRVFTVQDFEVVREAATGQYDGPAITVWKEGMR